MVSPVRSFKVALGLPEDVFRGALQGVALVVVEAADQVDGGHFGEGVDEGGAEPGHHVEVAGIRRHEGEQAGAVHPLAHGEHPVQVGLAVDDEIQLLQPAVARHVAEVQHPDIVALDEPDDVLLGEVPGGLLRGP